jgi:hypothetical protein
MKTIDSTKWYSEQWQLAGHLCAALSRGEVIKYKDDGAVLEVYSLAEIESIVGYQKEFTIYKLVEVK